MSWLKKNKRKLGFFVVFFLVCGSSSIWISYFFLCIGYKDVVVGLLTIAIASVCASAERILEKVHNIRPNEYDAYIDLLWVVSPVLISIFVLGVLQKSELWALFFSMVVYVVYCRLWWFQNSENKIFNKPTSALGGDVK